MIRYSVAALRARTRLIAFTLHVYVERRTCQYGDDLSLGGNVFTHLRTGDSMVREVFVSEITG